MVLRTRIVERFFINVISSLSTEISFDKYTKCNYSVNRGQCFFFKKKKPLWHIHLHKEYITAMIFISSQITQNNVVLKLLTSETRLHAQN